jgi:hypothetical protein
MSKRTKRQGVQNGFVARHSLSLIVGAIWLFWVLMYQTADYRTHIGSFYGNSIADWLGMLAFIILTKYCSEVGSAESLRPRTHPHQRLLRFVSRHSLTLVIIATGAGWVLIFARTDPESKAGQVYGNIVSEWGQLLMLIIMTKYFREEGSRES